MVRRFHFVNKFYRYFFKVDPRRFYPKKQIMTMLEVTKTQRDNYCLNYLVLFYVYGFLNLTGRYVVFISPHTVRNHICNIYQKLGVQNRIQVANLIRAALQNGDTKNNDTC